MLGEGRGGRRKSERVNKKIKFKKTEIVIFFLNAKNSVTVCRGKAEAVCPLSAGRLAVVIGWV